MVSAYFAPGPWLFDDKESAIYVVRSDGSASIQRPCAHLVQAGFARPEYFGNGVLIALAPRALQCLRTVRELLLDKHSSETVVGALTVLNAFLDRFDKAMASIEDHPVG